MTDDPLVTPSDLPARGSLIRRRRGPGPGSAALLALALAACSASGGAGSPQPTPPSTPATSAPASASLSPRPTQPAWPLAVTDDEGTRVALPAEPQRIVSLTPAETETLFALGQGGKLVGNGDADDYPAAAKAIDHVVIQQKVVLEKLVAAKPDLVIAGGTDFTPAADVARIRSLGIPVVVVYGSSVAGVLHDIELTGLVSGAYPAAVAIAEGMRLRIDALGEAARAAGGTPRTFYELGYGSDVYGPAAQSFVADLVGLAGGSPITTGDPRSYTIALERLVAADPEVILLGDASYDPSVTPASVGQRPGWAGMTAVKAGAIRPVDDVIITRPGPRLADGLAALALAIHPGLLLPAAPAASPGATP